MCLGLLPPSFPLSVKCSVHYTWTRAPQRWECLLNPEEQFFFFLLMLARQLLKRTEFFCGSVGGHGGEGDGTPLQYSCHGQRSLVGCSPWGREESDMTEWLHFQFSLSCIGEGNGNPLQCSCLENPRDGGAWWAAVYGVAQSRTRLKRLSSSSSSKTIEKLKSKRFFTLDCQNAFSRNMLLTFLEKEEITYDFLILCICIRFV